MSSRDVDIHRRVVDLLCLQFCDYGASLKRDSRERSRAIGTKQKSRRKLEIPAVNADQCIEKRVDPMRDAMSIVISLSISLGMVLLALVHGWLRLP